MEGFEDVLRWLYLSPRGPNLLGKANEAAKKIIANSQAGGKEKNGITIISKGAVLPLTKVVGRLEELTELVRKLEGQACLPSSCIV